MKKYTSPFSKSELRYFQTLMQDDTKAEGRGATYAKLEILLKEDLKKWVVYKMNYYLNHYMNK